MVDTVHNPDQYMYDLKHILTSGKKKIGILIGAGAPVSINVATDGTWKSLIPDIAGLTEIVVANLNKTEQSVYANIKNDVGSNNIELILSRIRSLSEVIGNTKIHGFDATGFEGLSKKICSEIKNVVSKQLPDGENPFSNLISWINGINREHAVEVFTTNYDLLLEEALERTRTPYFDGFSGSRIAFFDPSTISTNNLPARWVRLWKLHGSINWSKNSNGEITRSAGSDDGTMVYPSHIKYDQTQAAPFSALFERLKNFLLEPDSLLLTAGFSFADAHITNKLDECLAANGSSALIAFQYKNLDEETPALKIASRRPNMSVYCKNGATINGVSAPWKLGEPPSKNWHAIRGEYWHNESFLLGDFLKFTKFLAGSRGGKSVAIVELVNAVAEALAEKEHEGNKDDA
ncbi:SIR2 family protein [Rheinheimera sp.]|uniref:SIR2 family NAD-dependent protein deacylase n=1 Tax=Rheinheimera sp. TaxID=1869214 RepID=UPI002733760D|nr:SIR2 family protein [Rheinheimera sp.]MDP2716732.1 SIR2 family protein [Rheinheimera sp.]